MLIRNVILIVLGAFILYGCPEPPSYPIEPSISFDNFFTDGEIGYLSIAFTDGDGDIGLSESMTQPPFDTSSYYYYNMFVEYWEFNDASGQWFQPTFAGEPIIFLFRVPDITPTGKNKTLKGTIRVKMEPNYRNISSQYSDLIKYRIKLVDRELHESAWVESPPILNGVVQ